MCVLQKNILEALEKELSKPSWKHETINMGGVCDSYQPIESKLELTRDVLKLMIKYKNPIIISTKSSLILRDLDLIKELAEITSVNIACTITTLDDRIQKIIEPHASRSIDRFKVLKKLKEETKANVGVHLMPIIPYVTDSHENLDAIFHIASDINVDYVLPGTLYLRGKTKPHFLNSIKEYDYSLYQQLYDLYRKGSLSKEYKKDVYTRIHSYRKKYN
ncbi:MAG: radical SAM protein, partial [Coprobacillaceae bacterium]